MHRGRPAGHRGVFINIMHIREGGDAVMRGEGGRRGYPGLWEGRENEGGTEGGRERGEIQGYRRGERRDRERAGERVGGGKGERDGGREGGGDGERGGERERQLEGGQEREGERERCISLKRTNLLLFKEKKCFFRSQKERLKSKTS